LDRLKPGRRDVVVLHVRILRRAASGEQELDADQLFGSIEQQLFSQALSLSEKRGKSIRLAVVAANDLWDGILRAGQSLQSSTIVVGSSGKWQSEEQARQIGESWERLGDPKPQFNLEIHLPTGDRVFKVLGPHAPNLTANEVNLLHRLWLRFSDLVQPEELHHHDVVHFALEEVQTELDAGKEEELLNRLRAHLAANRNKKEATTKLTGICSRHVGAQYIAPHLGKIKCAWLFLFPTSSHTCEVQCPHRFAASGIGIAHCGQSCVVGATAGAGFAVQRFTVRTSRKIANATIRN